MLKKGIKKAITENNNSTEKLCAKYLYKQVIVKVVRENYNSSEFYNYYLLIRIILIDNKTSS